MYDSNGNYYGTLIPPISYGLGEGRSLMPSASSRSSRPAPPTHIPVDFATAFALAAASAAANNNNPNAVSNSGASNEVLSADKFSFCSSAGLNDYSAKSNSLANYSAMYLSRGAAGVGNSTFYPGNSWPYQNLHLDCDPVFHPAGDTLQASPYSAQFGDRVGLSASPYMMYPNGNADDLVEQLNCINLNDALAAQQPYMYPSSPLHRSDPMAESQWQSLVQKDRNGYAIGSGFNRLTNRYQQDSAYPSSTVHGDAHHNWAVLSGVKPNNSGDLYNGPVTRRSSHFTANDFVNFIGNSDNSGDMMALGFRQNRHRPRVQKNGERPLSCAPRGVIRDGVYERLTDTNITNLDKPVAEPSVGSITGEAFQARLMHQINPPTFNTSPSRARFFVIKSFSEDDIHRSIKYSIWCSTEVGNKKLNAAYIEAAGTGVPIYLFFSVNGSGHFCGIAEMISGVDYATRAGVWAQDKWQGQFSVKWIFVKDVPNVVLRHIHIETNDNKPVTHSRDTTEVPLEHGLEVLQIFAQYDNATSILDDFDYYERREQQELNRKETLRRR